MAIEFRKEYKSLKNIRNLFKSITEKRSFQNFKIIFTLTEESTIVEFMKQQMANALKCPADSELLTEQPMLQG